MIDFRSRAVTFSSFTLEWDNRAVSHHTLSIRVIFQYRGRNIRRHTFTFNDFVDAFVPYK